MENWEYMDIIRTAADPKCSAHLENTIETIDGILAREDRIGLFLKQRLKALFGVADLEHDDDFASLVEVCKKLFYRTPASILTLSFSCQSPLSSWQSKNWDPAVGSTKFDEFCEALEKPILSLHELDFILDGETGYQYDADRATITWSDGFEIDVSLFNYAKYIREVCFFHLLFRYQIIIFPVELCFAMPG